MKIKTTTTVRRYSIKHRKKLEEARKERERLLKKEKIKKEKREKKLAAREKKMFEIASQKIIGINTIRLLASNCVVKEYNMVGNMTGLHIQSSYFKGNYDIPSIMIDLRNEGFQPIVKVNTNYSKAFKPFCTVKGSNHIMFLRETSRKTSGSAIGGFYYLLQTGEHEFRPIMKNGGYNLIKIPVTERLCVLVMDSPRTDMFTKPRRN